MQKLLTGLVDLIFPPTPDMYTLRQTKPEAWPTLCKTGTHGHTTYLASYKNPLVYAAIREHKFHHNPQATMLLASLLQQWCKTISLEQTIFIPIPLSRQRQRERGHNQVTTILEAANLKTHTNTTLLKRHIHTTPQSHLSREDRLQNLQSVFSYRGTPALFTNKTTIVLIDDVITTGATMNAARSVLRANLPPAIHLHCVAIAH